MTLTQTSTVYTTEGSDERTTLDGAEYTFLLGPFPPVTATSTTTLPPSPGPTTTSQPPPPTGCLNCPPAVTVSSGEPGPSCTANCGRPCRFGCLPPVPCFPPGLGCNCIGSGCDGGGRCLGDGCLPGGIVPPPPGPPPPGPPPPTAPPGELPTSTSSSSSSSSTSADSCPLRIEESWSAEMGPDGELIGEDYNVSPPFSASPGGPIISRPGTTTPLTSTNSGTTLPPSTSTSYISCETQNQQPGQGITQAHCICDGSTFPQITATNPPNSCAYTTRPGSSATISITRAPTPTPAPRPLGTLNIIQRQEVRRIPGAPPGPPFTLSVSTSGLPLIKPLTQVRTSVTLRKTHS